jgi:glutamate-ammonia-ligase adenylyltransferase
MGLSFSPILQQQQKDTWQYFNEQHNNACKQLTSAQLISFKQAITLSDFILKAAIQAPELVMEVFSSDEKIDLPNYKELLAVQLGDCADEAELHRILRRFRLQQMVKIALDDLVFD